MTNEPIYTHIDISNKIINLKDGTQLKVLAPPQSLDDTEFMGIDSNNHVEIYNLTDIAMIVGPVDYR